MTEDVALSFKEISRLTEKSKSAIIRRALKGKWKGNNRQGNGGTRKEFPLSSLPPDIQTAYYNKVYQNALAAFSSLRAASWSVGCLRWA